MNKARTPKPKGMTIRPVSLEGFSYRITLPIEYIRQNSIKASGQIVMTWNKSELKLAPLESFSPIEQIPNGPPRTKTSRQRSEQKPEVPVMT